jgi:hypothetical protein
MRGVAHQQQEVHALEEEEGSREVSQKIGRCAVLDRVTPTTPSRELTNAEHRIRYLERALRDEPQSPQAMANAGELMRLQDVRSGWQSEKDANRRAWLAHHRRLYWVHLRLTREHFRALRRLEREVIPGDETPSANGNGNHE